MTLIQRCVLEFNFLSCRDLLLCLINFEVCKFSFCVGNYFWFIIYSISFDIRYFRFAIGESIWILYDVYMNILKKEEYKDFSKYEHFNFVSHLFKYCSFSSFAIGLMQIEICFCAKEIDASASCDWFFLTSYCVLK